MIFTGFAWQLPKTHSRMAESKGVLLMEDKGVYHLQKVGFTTPRGERVQVTHQQNTVGFLYGLLTSTKPETCVPSPQAERAEILPAKWQLFPPTSASECVCVRLEYKYGPCVCVTCVLKCANLCSDSCVWVSMCAYPNTCVGTCSVRIRVCDFVFMCMQKIESDTEHILK